MQIPVSFPLDISVERVISNVRFCSQFRSCDINFGSWSERTFQYAHTLCRNVVRLIEIQLYIEKRRDRSAKYISRVQACFVTFVRIDRSDWFFMRVTFAVCMQMSVRLPIKSWRFHTISKIHSQQSRRKRVKLYSIQGVLRSSLLRDISCPTLSSIFFSFCNFPHSFRGKLRDKSGYDPLHCLVQCTSNLNVNSTHSSHSNVCSWCGVACTTLIFTVPCRECSWSLAVVKSL